MRSDELETLGDPEWIQLKRQGIFFSRAGEIELVQSAEARALDKLDLGLLING